MKAALPGAPLTLPRSVRCCDDCQPVCPRQYRQHRHLGFLDAGKTCVCSPARGVKKSDAEKLSIQEQLEAIQKKDWKTLLIDEKKAGAFGFSLV